MRLSTLQDSHQMYSLLALDSLVEELSVPVNDQAALVQMVVTGLSPLVSGLVLDPYLGLAQLPHKAKGVGVALQLEGQNAVDPLALPSFRSEWGVEEISQNFGVAKLELYYHPQEEKALQKKQLVAEVMDYCHHQSIDLLLDLRLYEPPQVQTNSAQSLIEAVQEFHASCDAMIVDGWVDALTAVTVTAELDIPWLVALRGQPYAQLKEALRLCLESGAKGWYGGSGLWSGLPPAFNKAGETDWKLVESQLITEVRDRVLELTRITQEFQS